MARKKEAGRSSAKPTQRGVPPQIKVEIVTIDDGGRGLDIAYGIIARKILREYGAKECTLPSASE